MTATCVIWPISGGDASRTKCTHRDGILVTRRSCADPPAVERLIDASETLIDARERSTDAREPLTDARERFY